MTNTQDLECLNFMETKKACLVEVQKYSWLKLGTSLEQKDVAELVCKYILTHKWWINERIPFEITFEQASFSWFENVYQPIMRSLEDTGLMHIHQRLDITLIESVSYVSDSYYFHNKNDGSPFWTYQDVCRNIIRQIPGFWLTKFVLWLTRK